MADYFADVSWSTIARNVIPYRSSGTTFVLNTYLIDIYPIDSNEPGASTMEVAVNDYFIDYLGYPYTVLNVATISTYKQIRVYDINERSISESINYGPYTNQIGYVYRPTKNGVILSQSQLLNLATQARDRINNIEKGVVWENRGISIDDGGNIADNVTRLQLGNNLTLYGSGSSEWNGGISEVLGVVVGGTANRFLMNDSGSAIVNSGIAFSTLNTLADASNTLISSTLAIKTYIDAISSGGNFLDSVIRMVVDNSFDPGATPNAGDRYIIMNAASIHANFGTISGLGNYDIVEYAGSSFSVVFDASAATTPATVTVGTDINSNTNHQWTYNTTDDVWVDRGAIGNHNDLSGIDGGTTGQYFHLTSAQHTDLTDAGDSALHYHSTDRNRANHTGLQLYTTITDFVETVQDTVATQIQADSLSNITWTYSDALGTLTPTISVSGINYWTKAVNDLSYTAGNVSIGGAPSAYKLDVTGTSRFTSSITGVTESLSDNSTKLASTAYVKGQNYITLTSLSSTATGLTYTNTTGIFSLTSGYAIPTTAKQTQWDTAYTHSQDNSQAHSDYLINNGNDTTSGIITAAGFITAGQVTSSGTGNNSFMGNTGFGIATPSAKLHTYSASAGLKALYAENIRSAVTANNTYYEIVGQFSQTNNFNIATGITDNGYRMGLDIRGYNNDVNFKGTITAAYGIRVGFGNNSATATGTITNAYGLYLQGINNTTGGASITNFYSIYSSSTAKMFHAGYIGINKTPTCKLDVGVTHAINQFEEMRIGSVDSTNYFGIGFNYSLNGVGTPKSVISSYYGTTRYDEIELKLGKVGINGTPTTFLHVRGNVTGETARFENTEESGWLTFCEGTTIRGYVGYSGAGTMMTGASAASFGIRAQGDLHLGGGGNNLKMTINATGVGIGGAPYASFSVTQAASGTIATMGVDNNNRLNFYQDITTNVRSIYNTTAGAISTLQLGNVDAAKVISIDGATGLVGIGIAPTTYKLEVNGSVKIGTLAGYIKGTVGVLSAVTSIPITDITGTKSQYDASASDGNFMWVGDAPTSHTHGNITNAGYLGSTANIPLITGTSGIIQAGSFGTSANTFCVGDDSRLSDARVASDVYAWAKAATKPSYTYSEVGAAPLSHIHAISDVTNLQTTLDGKVDENTAIVGATHTKITYDAKGLVTAGSTPTTLSGYRIGNAYTKTESNNNYVSKTTYQAVTSFNGNYLTYNYFFPVEPPNFAASYIALNEATTEYVFNSLTTTFQNTSANAYVRALGFKKQGGTSTQYLMADGSISTLDADLTAIAALAGTSGLLKKTDTNAWTLDTAAYSTTVGTVTSVTAGNGMTQTGTSTINPTLNVVSAAGTSDSVGTLTITSDSVGVTLGTTSTTAAKGNHTHNQIDIVPDAFYTITTSWDIAAHENAYCTTASSQTITMSNVTAGQSGILIVYPTANIILTLAGVSTIKIDVGAPTNGTSRELSLSSGVHYILTFIGASTTLLFVNVAEYKTF